MSGIASPAPHLAVRTEVWESSPGAHRALLAVRQDDETRALALALDPTTLTWTYGILALAGRHAGACRDALVDACVTKGDYPAVPGALQTMGLLQGDPNRLAQHAIFSKSLVPVDARFPFDKGRQHTDRLATRGGPPQRDLPGCPRGKWRGLEIRYGMSPHQSHPQDAFSLHPCTGVGVRTDLTLPASPARVAFRHVTLPDTRDGRDLRQAHAHHSQSDMARILTSWSRDVSALLRPVAISFLHESCWTPGAYAHFMRAGDIGTWRRQAARLYPALATVQMHEPEVSAAIDAARPFEPHLAAALGRWIEPHLAPRLTTAALRRMRTFPAGISMDVLSEIASSLTTLPVSWLPSTGSEWAGFTINIPYLHRTAALLGIDRVAMLREANQSTSPLTGCHSHVDCSGAIDMARRLSDTLLAALGHAPADPGTMRIAGRLLYEGRSLRSISEIETLWHARLSRFEADLPSGRDLVSWPALFEPFSACDGEAEIVCLTLPSELASEGSAKPDRQGHPGLDHCSGGYGRECHAGLTTVASVRSTVPTGPRRLSTLELGFDWNSGQSWIEQHKGLANGDPPELAKRAVQELLDAIPKGRVRINPEAGPNRPRGEYVDGCDWSEPGMAEATYDAWSPFLLKHRPATLDGLRRRIAEITTLAG